LGYNNTPERAQKKEINCNKIIIQDWKETEGNMTRVYKN
jgi:hypothetical protein